MALFQAYQNRGITKTVVITDADGTTKTPGANDQVRIIIGHEGKLGADPGFADAQLVVASDAPTSNGSTITKGAINTIRLDASDLNFAAGVYTMFVDFFNNADSGAWKTVDRQIFNLEST